MKNLKVDFVIETCLVAIYKDNLLNENLYLKGGQYLRVKENIKSRFSVDTDFSYDGKIDDHEVYFETLEKCLALEFHNCGYYLFSFKAVRKPKMKSEDVPDFWQGWGVEFKLIEESKRNLPQEKLDVQALVPQGTTSPKILIDISEYEYCQHTEFVKVNSTEIKTYSRALVILEKLRAICQQHKDYPLKDGTSRARDFYDIERLWNKTIFDGDDSLDELIKQLNQHLSGVFGAKKVSLDLIKKIQENEFITAQSSNWASVQQTVKAEDLQPFDYYVSNLKELVKKLKI